MLIAAVLLAWVIVGKPFAPDGCRFESSDGGMADFEMLPKGRTLAMVEALFEEYKARKGDPTLRLYRTSERDWGYPLRWPDYLLNRRWWYPYRKPTKGHEGSLDRLFGLRY